ncbi:MAG: NAD(P)-binding protein, partial [Caldimonas sp.]
MKAKTTFPTTPEDAAGVIRVAVIGAGLAGASCSRGLRDAEAQVTVFERSRHVGGRMATRQATWIDDVGSAQLANFDHGAQCFTAVRPRFREFMARAVAEGRAARWQPVVHSSRSVASERCFVPTPTTRALCSGLLAGAKLHLERTVRRLQRAVDG